jgi:GT2 family glycosyltransferase
MKMIKNFDENKYLDANPDIKEAVENGDFKSGLDHLEKVGLEEIKNGRKFHPEFEPYNEEKYLEIFPDIKEAVEKGLFNSGFEHFCLYGYNEIINGLRNWPKTIEIKTNFNKKFKKINKLNSEKNKLIVVLGIPRSGITLLTGLIGSNSKISEWFMPYSTRKNLGIEKFENFEDIKKEYLRAFPQEKELFNNIVISESTSDENTIPWLFDSLKKLKENNDIKIIWVIRDIATAYLSFVDAARQFWGAKNLEINNESFTNFINMSKRSYRQIIENIKNFDNKIVRFKDIIQNSEQTLNEIMDFINISYEPSQIEQFRNLIKDYKVAGCQKFLSFDKIENDIENKRNEEWSNYTFLLEKLDEKNKLFINDFKEIVNGNFNNLNDYINYILNNNFDKDFYLKTYEDIRINNVEPISHYLNYGWKENRKPISYFDTEWYKENIDFGDFNPFIHWLLIGKYFFNLGEKIGKVENLKLIDPENYEIKEGRKLIAPKFDRPKVSIIIPAYNQANYTLACVDSIIQNTKGVSYEIIIMDDNSPDPKAKEIEKYMENVIFISNGINYGFLENCNKGARLAKGEYILFLNNDTNVQPGWLNSLVELIESDEKIGMVGSKLIYPNGQQQEAGGIIWKDASAWNFGRLDDPTKPEYNYVKECDYISGASIMIRKELWDKIGGFDKRYKPAYFEDSDLAFEVRKHGYKVMFQPKSVVVHFEGISHGTDTSSGIKSYQVKNREKFVEKWKDVLEKENFENGQDVFIARDRSRFKKHILFIDHYVPHYDQDAGSRTVFGYIKLFLSEGYSVKFIGDNFYPHQPYTDTLQQLGVEVLYGPYYANNWQKWIKENGKYFDYIFMNRPHISEKYIDFIKEYTKAKIVYYGHDLHFLREKREYLLTNDENKLKSSEEWKKREFNLIKKADIALYPSEVEIEEIKTLDPTIKVKAIPAYLFESFENKERNIKNTRDIMFVGGFSHTPNIDAVLWFIENVWNKIKKEIPDIKFYVIGSKPPEEITNLASEDIIVTGFVSDEELSEYYQKCRISIVPLRYGAGIKGKVVEALYNQIPIVTTSIGAEGLNEAHNYMIIADDADKFAESVISLYNDCSLLKTLSQKSVEYCKKYFSYSAAKNVLKDIFEFGE